MEKQKQKSPNLHKTFEELEQISEWFSRDDIDIDEALAKYKRGMELVKIARERLKEAENEFEKIEKLSEK